MSMARDEALADGREPSGRASGRRADHHRDVKRIAGGAVSERLGESGAGGLIGSTVRSFSAERLALDARLE